MEIEQSHLVEKVFGRWPSFHDAEVISIELRRGNPASLLSSIHIRQYAPADIGTVQFDMVLTHDFIITLEFVGVSNVYLSDFNHQNVIDELSIFKEGDLCKVGFESIYGVECRFSCISVRVAGIVDGCNV